MGISRASELLASRMAARQCGLVSRAQLLAAGFTARAIGHRLATGRLTLVLPEVYALAGVPASYEQDLWAAHLWSGDQSAVSHGAAAKVWGFDSIDRRTVEISTLCRKRTGEVTLPRGAEVIVHRVDEHLLGEIVTMNGLPVTSPRRTLLDLCGRKHRRSGRLLDEALRRHLVNVGDLWLYLEQEWMRGRRGVAILRALLVDRTPGQAPSDSMLELELRALIDSYALPAPVHQYPVEIPAATIHIDIAYPDSMLAIEVDGYSFHMDQEAFERDRERDNELRALGWTVLRFTWAMIRFQPHRTIELIRAHLPEQPSVHMRT